MRGRVARETRLGGHPNDAVFAVLPKLSAPAVESKFAAEAPEPGHIDYALQGDFVFLAPEGARVASAGGSSEAADVLAARRARLPAGQFVDCADCPTMVDLPGNRIALAATETTYAQWDACYREFGCRRFLPDDGEGRGDRPAAGMTWQDALEFAAWVDTEKGDSAHCEHYRLPTRQEWLDIADRQPTLVAAPAELGNAVCRGCGAGHDEGRSLAVASLPSDAFGLHDLTGNVWEWVDDGEQCDFSSLLEGRQCTDGTVMGGSFATAADALSPRLEGHLPRTSNEWPWSWPTVGGRVACEKRDPISLGQ